jgi:hypothetical protein
MPGCLLVYDVTSRRSFDSVRTWLADVRAHADAHVSCILVGNKVDLVSGAEGQGECFLSFLILCCLWRGGEGGESERHVFGVGWRLVGWRLAADVVESVLAQAVGRSAWVQDAEWRRSLCKTMRGKGRDGGRGREGILWVSSSVNCAGCGAELWI